MNSSIRQTNWYVITGGPSSGYARIEDEPAQKKIHELLTEVYESLTSPIVPVPVLGPMDRVNFILKNVQ